VSAEIPAVETAAWWRLVESGNALLPAVSTRLGKLFTTSAPSFPQFPQPLLRLRKWKKKRAEMRLEEKCEIIEIKLDIHIAVRRQSMGRRSHASTALWFGAAKEAPHQGFDLATPIQSGVARGTSVPRLPPQSKIRF